MREANKPWPIVKDFVIVIKMGEADKEIVIAKVNEVKRFNGLPNSLDLVFEEVVT